MIKSCEKCGKSVKNAGGSWVGSSSVRWTLCVFCLDTMIGIMDDWIGREENEANKCPHCPFRSESWGDLLDHVWDCGRAACCKPVEDPEAEYQAELKEQVCEHPHDWHGPCCDPKPLSPTVEQCDPGCAGPRAKVNCNDGRHCGCPCHYGDAEFCVRWDQELKWRKRIESQLAELREEEKDFKEALLGFLGMTMILPNPHETGVQRLNALRRRFLPPTE